MMRILKKYTFFGNQRDDPAIGRVMTSFLNSTTPTAAKAPGGVIVTDGENGMTKLVALHGGKTSQVPTSFLKSDHLTGGTGAKANGRSTVCQGADESGMTSSDRGIGNDVSPASFLVVAIGVFKRCRAWGLRRAEFQLSYT